jgi:small subunit ribosomal protein S13
MPRILGIEVPNAKPTHVALRSLYGVGPATALLLCEQAGVDPRRRAGELSEDDVSRLAGLLEGEHLVEGALRRQEQENLSRLQRIGCYRGQRHRRGLPVRGQRTRSNARTRKGRRRTVPSLRPRP